MDAKIPRKGLAQGTRPQYAAPMDPSELWAELPPPLRGYEVSNTGRVRKWASRYGRPGPRLYRGCVEGSTVVYRLKGERYSIDELMQAAFGDEAEDMDAGYDPRGRDRELSQYERNEIKLAEGWKPAFEVAQDFRIDSDRVRKIWDGLG